MEDKTIEQIKDEYNFDDVKDASHDGQDLMDCFLVMKMKALSMPATFYHLMKTIMSFYLSCIYQSLFVESANTSMQYTNNLLCDKSWDQIDGEFNLLVKLKILLKVYVYLKCFTIFMEAFHLLTTFYGAKWTKNRRIWKNIYENFVLTF